MDIIEATKQYESWLSGRTPIIQRDLEGKHKAMAQGPFPFLRATFYRWAQLWPKLVDDLGQTPVVLAVGDLHIENFGTWRDAEGRLVWGINDFDEACPMPYAIDLVRLAVSARLAIGADCLRCDPDRACEAVLAGYTEALEQHGHPFVLAEHDRWLRRIAQRKKGHPVLFWKKLCKAQPIKKLPPQHVQKTLQQDLPEAGLRTRFVHRQAGVGSLGRPRCTLLSEWRGSLIAREAKPLIPSAWLWAQNKVNGSKVWYEQITDLAVRVPDPFLKVCDGWVIRRLAPDCSRIELNELPAEWDELRLLRAMGWETGNVHLGSVKAVPLVKRDLRRQPRGWLLNAARRMERATRADWKQWKSKWKRSD